MSKQSEEMMEMNKFFFKRYKMARENVIVILKSIQKLQKIKCKIQSMDWKYCSKTYKIITFIDLQTLLTVIHSQVEQSHEFKLNGTEKKLKRESKIKHMIQVHCFLKQYLNLTDRSMYYSFYDEPEFVCISKQLEQNIVIAEGRNHQPNLSIKYSQMTQLFEMVQKQQLIPIEQLDELKRILADPSLPLPPLKRQNEGIYCNSSFQLFLVGLRFPHCSQQTFSPFEELKQKISDQEDISFKQYFAIQKQKHTSMKVYKNLHLVRYMPYEITYQNFKGLMLKENTLHNMVVTVFAVTDIWIEAIFSIVNAIEDPFYKLVEMMSRYAVFRSYVIELEDSLGFLFKSYQNLYSDTIRDSLFQSSAIKPKYCFWRPALAKWFLKMSPIHQQTNCVYFMLLTKLRQEALLGKLNDISGDPAWKVARKHEIILRNGLELNEFSGQMREKLYAKMEGSSVIEEFISNNPDTCETLVFEYVEYFIDLAINEQTVHWCGHSNHRLQKPFNLFNQEFSSYNHSFIGNLKNQVLADISSKESKKNILQLLIQADVEFLQTKNVKPIMIKSFLDEINLKRMFFEDLIETDQHFKPNVQMKQTIKEQEIEKNNSLMQAHQQIVSFDFEQKDQKLKYFNEKAKICESIEGQEKCFFSIHPLLSPEEILIKSINTNDTSENEDSDANSSFEYVSDNQSEQLNSQVQGLKFTYSNNQSQNMGEKGEKKVKFQIMHEDEMKESEEGINEKKTLHSTNSSSKESQAKKVIEQNEKCPEEQEFLIVKSQSI